MPRFPRTTLCVVGGTGFIASHIIKKLLEDGHDVHVTVRDPSSKKCDFLRDLSQSEPVKSAGGTLTLFKADLLQKGSFDEAFKKCKVVIHTAAVVKSNFEKDPYDEIITPAVEGASEVARAASKYFADGTLTRIVQTSSVSAVHQKENDRRPDKRSKPFDETEWRLDLRPWKFPYEAAKVLAERAINEIFPGEVTAILPSFTLGPMLSDDVRSTLQAVTLFANREMPVAPSSNQWFVDVRDVAEAHICAAFAKKSTSNDHRIQRFICAQKEYRPMVEIGKSINKQFYPSLSAQELVTPGWLLWLISFVDKRISAVMLEELIYHQENLDNTKIQNQLEGFKFSFNNFDQTIKDCVDSMVELGIVKKKKVKQQ